jgi:hypothetical protein
MLIHRCTLHIPGQQTGEDDYGQPTYSDPENIENVLCRADQVKKFISRDTNGENYITQYVLFTGPGQELNNSMTVKDLKDRDGNVVLFGSFSLQDAQPIYGRARLHHYEAVLKGSE